MAKKEGFMDNLKKTIMPIFLGNLKEMVKSAIENIQESVHKTIKFTIKKIYSYFLILAGTIFFIAGASMLIENSFTLPKGSGFMITGIVVVIFGFLLNALTKRG